MADVMWLPILFVSVTMVMALVGNCLVLIVFHCRWRSTGATKVYVLSLAALDMCSAVFSTPRELLSLTDNIRGSEMGQFCRVFTFIVYIINLSSALLLVVIAASRYVKVISEEQGGQDGRVRGWCKLKVAWISTVKGAKVAVSGAMVLSVIVTSPVAVLLDRGGGNCSARDDIQPNCTCYASCLTAVAPENKPALEAVHIFHFLIFVAIVAALTALYGAVWRCLRETRKEELAERASQQQQSTSASSIFYTRRSGSWSTLCASKDSAGASGPDGKHAPLNRTLSEGDAVAVFRYTKREADTGRHASNPFTRREMAQLRRNKAVSRSKFLLSNRNDLSAAARDESEAVVDTNRMTYFPPVSYSAQLRSQLSLNKTACQPPQHQQEEEEGDSEGWLQRHGSVASFQFRKHGDRSRQTTLVFLIISVVFVLSFLPFFVVLIANRDRCGGSAVVEVLARFYLLNNASSPLVYGLCNPYFRRTLWKCIVCRREVI